MKTLFCIPEPKRSWQYDEDPVRSWWNKDHPGKYSLPSRKTSV